MIRHTKFDCVGCNYGIYKVEKGYVIYGEIEITMLDFDFTKTDKKPFELHENSICLYDFEDNFYEIDYDGNLIN